MSNDAVKKTHKSDGVTLAYDVNEDHELTLYGLSPGDRKKAFEAASPKRSQFIRSTKKAQSKDFGPVLVIRLRPRTANLDFEEITSNVLDRLCAAIARSRQARVKPSKDRFRKDPGYVHRRAVAPQTLRL